MPAVHCRHDVELVTMSGSELLMECSCPAVANSMSIMFSTTDAFYIGRAMMFVDGNAGRPVESRAEGQTRRESYSQGLSQCLQTGILIGCPWAALPVLIHLLLCCSLWASCICTEAWHA